MSADAGTLYVDVVARLDALERQIASRATAAGRMAGQQAGGAMAHEMGASLRRGFTQVGIAAAAVAGAGLLVSRFAEAAEQAAAADRRIDAVASSMGLVGGQYVLATARVKEYAAEVSRSLAVDDETVKTVQTKLMTFRALGETMNVTGGAFDRATRAAFDLAALGFGSAETNAVQLGKALQDPIKGLTALARAGVTFTEAEKAAIAEMVKMGQVGKAQEAILAAIEGQVKGAAEASVTGAQRMARAWGEVEESLGSALAPAMGALADATEVLEDKVSGLFDSVGAAMDAYGRAAARMSGETYNTEAKTEALKKALATFPNLLNGAFFAVEKLADGLANAGSNMIRLRELLGLPVDVVLPTATFKETAKAAGAVATGLASLTEEQDAANDSTADGETVWTRWGEAVSGAMEGAAERGRELMAAMETIAGIRADMADMRFEAGLYGLDAVTAATRRLQRAREDLAAAPVNDSVARAEAEREVLEQQIALQQAQADAAADARAEQQAAAEAAAAARKQAVEEARQARQQIADALGNGFARDIAAATRDQIKSSLRGLLTQVRDVMGDEAARGIADLVNRTNDRLGRLADRRDRLVERFQKAKDRLEELEAARATLEEQVRSQATGGGLVTFAEEALKPDAEGVAPTPAAAAQGLLARLQYRLREIRDYAANLRKLAARGLPQEFINELIQAGPTAGAATARLLANSPEADFQGIKSAAVTLYTESGNLAKQAGQTMYGAGIEAANGLVRGLQAKEEAIAKQMIRISQIMVRAIRRALGIQSPSKVFAGLGGSIGDGLAQGINGRQGAVAAATAALVEVPSASRLRADVSVTGQPQPAGTAAGGFVVNTLVVNNPTAEPASTSVADGLRRTAFVLGGAR